MPASHADSIFPPAPMTAPDSAAEAPRLETSDEADARVEQMSMDSFPASDPPSTTLTITTQGSLPPVRR